MMQLAIATLFQWLDSAEQQSTMMLTFEPVHQRVEE